MRTLAAFLMEESRRARADGQVGVARYLTVLAGEKALDAVMPITFQSRAWNWAISCFGPVIARDRVERNHRFLEESLELVQALGCTREEAEQLVDYVFNRPVGEAKQEVGGVFVTLACLCTANHIDLNAAGETELVRIHDKIVEIRAKQAAKPKHSPLPQAVTMQPDDADLARLDELSRMNIRSVVHRFEADELQLLALRMKTRIDELEQQLQTRNDFIVTKQLWSEFETAAKTKGTP